MNTKNRLGYYFVPLPHALFLDTVSRDAVYLWGIIYLLQRRKRLQTNVEIFKLMPVSRNKLQRLLAELESAGWIVWNRRSSSERFILLTTVANHDGAVVNHDGAVVNHDGAVVNHDGAVVNHDGAVVGHDGAVVGHDGAVVGHDGAVVGHPKTQANPTGRAKGANGRCDRHETHETHETQRVSHSDSHSDSHSLTDEQIKEIEEEEARRIKTFKTRLQKHEERKLQ